ncbi:MAG: hypothetical protein VX938_00160 [Myxococcota bacterium]|nr:hypothetical protein [Myxococcota bacterium]MEE2780433.1 hypothetical protein [Myxococcota bacterium]
MVGRVGKEKRETFLDLLDRGVVMLHIDARRDGVVVPGYLKGDPALRLNIAYGFNLPSLEIDDEGVYAVLSFRGANAGCNIPWEAVYAMTLPGGEDDGSVVWPSDVPTDLGVAATPLETEPEVPALSLVESAHEAVDEHDPSESGAEAGEPEPLREENPDPPKRPHLRLVKD